MWKEIQKGQGWQEHQLQYWLGPEEEEYVQDENDPDGHECDEKREKKEDW